MRRFKPTILGVMSVVLIFGVALAALKNSNGFWSKSIVTITLLVMLSAILGSLFSRGPVRAFWVGYSLFGWFLLILWGTPWLPTEFFTHAVFHDLEHGLFILMHPRSEFATASFYSSPPGSELYMRVAMNFQNTFYALFSHLIGLFGGGVGYGLARRKERQPVVS